MNNAELNENGRALAVETDVSDAAQVRAAIVGEQFPERAIRAPGGNEGQGVGAWAGDLEVLAKRIGQAHLADTRHLHGGIRVEPA